MSQTYARSRALSVLAAVVFLVSVGPACESPGIAPRTRLDEPQFLAFRCVVGDGAEQRGVPLEGCGCTVPDDGGFRTLGPVECTCTTRRVTPVNAAPNADLSGAGPDIGSLYDETTELDVEQETVRWIEVEQDTCEPVGPADGTCAEAWTCEPARHAQTGDWIPAAAPQDDDCPGRAVRRPEIMRCEPAGDGDVRAYVGSTGRGEIAVVELTHDNEILDRDRSIPGSTAIFVDDLVSDIGVHPDGAFIFTVNSSSGSISLVVDDTRIAAELTTPLVPFSLLNAVVSPSPVGERSDEWREQRREAFISAPLEGVVVRLDLQAVADGLDRARDPEDDTPLSELFDPGTLIVDIIAIQPSPLAVVAPRPGALAVDDRGETLFVAHLESPRVTAIDLTADDPSDAANQRVIDIGPGPCTDGYLTDVVDPLEARTCHDGLDNDGDGKTDAGDSDCRDGGIWEGTVEPRMGELTRRVPACPQLLECRDGVDNDRDGKVDADDEDCDVDIRWERPTPACSDGEINEGELGDRDDPDCVSESDDSEEGRELSTCADGEDNDGGGGIDADDPDCQAIAPEGIFHLPDERFGYDVPDDSVDVPLCFNGVDDDLDGLVDGTDPGCRDRDAARRYRFEAVPECANEIDDDHDGLIDYAGGDTDCYAASDNDEGGAEVTLGPTQVVYARVFADRTEREFLYLADRASDRLFAVDVGRIFEDEMPTPRNIRIPGGVQGLAVRRVDREASLLVVGEDNALRTVEITAETPVTDQDGRQVFAHVELSDVVSELRITAFYVIEDQIAWALAADQIEVGRVHLGQEVVYLARESPVVTSSLDGLEPGTWPSDDQRVEVLNPQATHDSIYDRGQLDRRVVLLDRYEIFHDETNQRSFALERTNRVFGTPDYSYGADGARVPFDPERHPTFCVLDSASAPLPSEGSPGDVGPPDAGISEIFGDCVPVEPTATRADNDRLVVPSRERTRHRVGLYDGIDVVAESPEVIPAGEHSIVFEGVLPGSASRSGQFGARSPDDEYAWSLLDYDRDFCAVGVQPNDILLVDRLVPSGSSNVTDDETEDLCADLRARASVTPIRYRVASTSAHALELVRDDRENYASQMPPEVGGVLPQIREAPLAPRYECASQFISYKIRVQNDQWLLLGPGNRYRHPWINRNGQCEEYARYSEEGRVGRVGLGEVFENEWFKFRLGFLQYRDRESGDVIAGVADGRTPNLVRSAFGTGNDPRVDTARFRFSVDDGESTRRLDGVSILPRELRWLPFDDHLYIVDSARGTIIEVAGLSPSVSAPFIVRLFN